MHVQKTFVRLRYAIIGAEHDISLRNICKKLEPHGVKTMYNLYTSENQDDIERKFNHGFISCMRKLGVTHVSEGAILQKFAVEVWDDLNHQTITATKTPLTKRKSKNHSRCIIL